MSNFIVEPFLSILKMKNILDFKKLEDIFTFYQNIENKKLNSLKIYYNTNINGIIYGKHIFIPIDTLKESSSQMNLKKFCYKFYIKKYTENEYNLANNSNFDYNININCSENKNDILNRPGLHTLNALFGKKIDIDIPNAIIN